MFMILSSLTPNAPQTKFENKDLGNLHYFLGIEANFISKGLLLHQAKFAHEIITQAKMEDAHVDQLHAELCTLFLFMMVNHSMTHSLSKHC